jgi:hypothetical protein
VAKDSPESVQVYREQAFRIDGEVQQMCGPAREWLTGRDTGRCKLVVEVATQQFVLTFKAVAEGAGAFHCSHRVRR